MTAEPIPSGKRTLESDIFEFTKGLPYWSQYLSEKLLSGVDLSDADYKFAYQYLEILMNLTIMFRGKLTT